MSDLDAIFTSLYFVFLLLGFLIGLILNPPAWRALCRFLKNRHSPTQEADGSRQDLVVRTREELRKKYEADARELDEFEKRRQSTAIPSDRTIRIDWTDSLFLPSLPPAPDGVPIFMTHQGLPAYRTNTGHEMLLVDGQWQLAYSLDPCSRCGKPNLWAHGCGAKR